MKLPVIDAQTLERVRALRAQGRSPMEIARSVGISRATASDLVRRLAAEDAPTGGEGGRVDCLLNPGWSTGLSVAGPPEWHDPGATESTGGLLTALVARRRPHRRLATVCIYLVDAYCLGVKDAIGPEAMDARALRGLVDHVFSGYRTAPIVAPIELVRELVLGAAAYARRLGFAPHPDFAHARAHLGPWAGPGPISFGRHGKPTYIAGPHDDTDRVLRTLRRTVGADGFNYAVDLGELPLTG